MFTRPRLGHRQLARLARVPGVLPQLRDLLGLAPGPDRGVLGQRPAVPDRRGPDPRLRARPGRPAQPARPGLLPGAAAGHVLRRPVPGAAGHPRHLHARVRHPRPGDRRRAGRAVLLGHRDAHAPLLGVRLRGLPGGHRLGPPQPGCRRPVARPLALPVAAARRPAPGGPARDPAPAQRLHRAPEGHGARLVPRRGRDLPDGPDQADGDVQLHAVSSRSRWCSSSSRSRWRGSSTGSIARDRSRAASGAR